MRILIIEDDIQAFHHLNDLLHNALPDADVVGNCGSIKAALRWFRTNKPPDLVFSVVELPDGLSFEIFKALKSRIPVIFTCKREKYAINAFSTHSVHYLKKPVQIELLKEALDKFETNFGTRPTQKRQKTQKEFQRRFLVSVGQQLKLIKAEDIAYFYTKNKVVYLVTCVNSKYLTDFTLEKLESVLDPAMFFRINRQFIINMSAIVKMFPASKSRLKIVLKPETNQDTITSASRTDSFYKWLLSE